MNGNRYDIRPRESDEKGFTLLEMVLVATLITILSTLAVASMSQARNKGFETGAATGLKAIASAQEMYLMDNGRYAFAFSALARTYIPRSYPVDADRGEFIKNYSLQWVQGGGGGPRPPITNYSVMSYTVFAVPLDNRLKTFVITESGGISRAITPFNWTPY